VLSFEDDMVVGTCISLAGFLNSAQVQREPGVPGLPSPELR
jgi:hypothetical protein